MPGTNRRAEPSGRFGTLPQLLSTGPIGGANYLGGASPLTANDTTIFPLGAVPVKSMASKLTARALQVPADADGTILAYLFKYDASANAAVQLTGALDLEALVTREGAVAELLSTLTPEEATLEVGDCLEVHVVNNSAAINTQPTGLVFVAEHFVIDG